MPSSTTAEPVSSTQLNYNQALPKKEGGTHKGIREKKIKKSGDGKKGGGTEKERVTKRGKTSVRRRKKREKKNAKSQSPFLEGGRSVGGMVVRRMSGLDSQQPSDSDLTKLRLQLRNGGVAFGT